MSILKPIATDKEIKLNPKRMIVSKTDTTGKIIYGNDYFCEISGYKESELISSPHSILRHPDMPKAVFYLMWDYLKAGRNIMAVVKNMTKYGDYYWVTTDFDIKRDNLGNIKYYVAYRQAAPKQVVVEIERLYRKLLAIEKEHDMKASISYLEAFLEEKGMNYDQYIENLAKPKGLAAIFFEKMKRFF
jgi:PAS domain S-box-containing protein